jgi:hypothetical protein
LSDSYIQAYMDVLMDYEKRIGDDAIKIQIKMEEDAKE